MIYIVNLLLYNFIKIEINKIKNILKTKFYISDLNLVFFLFVNSNYIKL